MDNRTESRSEVTVIEHEDRVEIRIPKLHDAQAHAYGNMRRFNVLNCGRRWGKGQYALYVLTRALNENPGLYWWVGLSWTSASVKRAWRLAKQWLEPFGATWKETDHEIYLPNGSQLWFRTAANPDSLAGEGVRGVVLDEYCAMDSTIWQMLVRPTLSDYAPPDGHDWNMNYSWAIFTGTPRGEGWHANIYRLGLSGSNDDWISFQFPTATNPFIPKQEIESAKKDMPELIFRQEYLAEIIEGSGTVFKGVYDAAILEPASHLEWANKYTIMGVDWGKVNDFTVIEIIGRQGWKDDPLVHLFQERFNKISYAYQKRRLVEIVKRWMPNRIIGEANSMGEALIDSLRVDYSINIQPFWTSNKSKADVIVPTASAIENKELLILNDEVLKTELTAYQVIQLPKSENYRYQAPNDVHDDTVIALSLAHSGFMGPKVGVRWAY